VSTAASIAGSGEYAVAAFAARTSTGNGSITYTPGGSWTNLTSDASVTTTECHSAVDYQSGPTSGSALTDTATVTSKTWYAAGAVFALKSSSTNALFGSLQDTFGGSSLNATLWANQSAGSSTAVEGGGVLTLTQQASSTNSAVIGSNSTYDLTGSSITVELVQAETGTTNSQSCFQVLNAAGTQGYFYFENSGFLEGSYEHTSGTYVTVFSIAYSATAHKWLRLRESAGTTYWDAAPDGLTWTNLGSVADEITLTALYVTVAQQPNVATDPAAFSTWANFNVVPSLVYSGTDGTLGSAAVPGHAQPGNFIPGQVNVTATNKNLTPALATATGTAQIPKLALTQNLATGTGTAQTPATSFTISLATATGSAQAPVTGNRNVGLATGTGTAQAPGIGLLIGLATATGTAQAPATGLTTGLATGPGTAEPVTFTGITAGLASGTGSARSPGSALTAGLASATSTAQIPTFTSAVSAIPELATATGSAQLPAVGITAGLATATGTAQVPAYTVTFNLTPGLASATGSAQAPATGLTTGLASGTGTAQAPSAGNFTPALATGTGTAQIPVNGSGLQVTPTIATATGSAQPVTFTGITAVLATATGTAQAAVTGLTTGVAGGTSTAQVPSYALTPALATATGTAQAPATGNRSIGFASGTGTAQAPVYGLTSNLATASGTAQVPSHGFTPALATATGTAQAPAHALTTGLASGTGSGLTPGTAVRAGLASATGTAYSVGTGYAAGLAGASGTAQAPGSGQRTAGLAGGSGNVANPTAQNGSARPPENLGGTVIPEYLAGSDSEIVVDYGGTNTQVNYGGGATVTLTGISGAADTVVSTLGGSGTQVDFGGTIALTAFGGGVTGWSMQNVNLSFAEFNDITLNVTITSNGSALNLTGYTVNMLMKPAAGVADNDGRVITLSSSGGSPAITITNASAGAATVAISHADLQNETLLFYRIDAVDGSGNINTAIYGNLSYISL
jgi:hypothetical protein